MMLLFKPSSTFGRKSKSRPYLSFSESLLNDSIEAAETHTRKWIGFDISSSSYADFSIFTSDNRLEGRRYIDIINSLYYAIQGVILVNPDFPKLSRAQNLVKFAMKHLEKEFLRILQSNRKSLDPDFVSIRSYGSFSWRKVSGYTNLPKSEDINVMMDLKMIADCMVTCGHKNECAKIYKMTRRSIIEEEMKRLGFENLSVVGKAQKLDWEVVEKNIKKWIEATKVVINTLFDGERNLSNHVFSTSHAVAESCFSEITQDSALSLFVFPANVAKCKKSVEKIFLTLDVYQTISQLLPQIEEIFSYNLTSAVRFQAADSLRTLGVAINSMVTEFESSITKESSKTPIPGGGVHQLTRYVMNFIVFLADYHEFLADILTGSTLPLPEDYFGIKENDNNNNADGSRSSSASASSPMTTRIAWLILVLLCKIDTKSRLYDDMALSYLFLANNLHYVISKVLSSNLRIVLGDEWVTNHQGKVVKYLEKYEKKAWREVMTSLPDVNDEKMLEEHVAKERLKRFNETFEIAYKKHSTWLVLDSTLRDDLKSSVSKKLTSLTTSFYEKYHVETWEQAPRYAPDDLGNYISELFTGTGGSCVIVPSPKKSDSPHSLKPSESGR